MDYEEIDMSKSNLGGYMKRYQIRQVIRVPSRHSPTGYLEDESTILWDEKADAGPMSIAEAVKIAMGKVEHFARVLGTPIRLGVYGGPEGWRGLMTKEA